MNTEWCLRKMQTLISKHITVLEESPQYPQKDFHRAIYWKGSNVMGKSVEMITNAIAEMRTYGEGFIIVDQSPNFG